MDKIIFFNFILNSIYFSNTEAYKNIIAKIIQKNWEDTINDISWQSSYN